MKKKYRALVVAMLAATSITTANAQQYTTVLSKTGNGTIYRDLAALNNCLTAWVSTGSIENAGCRAAHATAVSVPNGTILLVLVRVHDNPVAFVRILAGPHAGKEGVIFVKELTE